MSTTHHREQQIRQLNIFGKCAATRNQYSVQNLRLFVPKIVFLFKKTLLSFDETVQKGGQLLGKLISRKHAEKKKQKNRRSDPAARSNNISIVYFIIHLWMCSGRINRNP